MDHDVNIHAIQTIEAVVIRCKCGKPDSHQGQVCPNGKRVDLGTISYLDPDHPIKTAVVSAAIRIKRFMNKEKEK